METFIQFAPLKVGEIIYVRETFCVEDGSTVFKADLTFKPNLSRRWSPSLHMRRELSRIHLEVMRVRVERACDISEEDALAEGFDNKAHELKLSPKLWFKNLWWNLYGSDAWEKFVWCYNLKRVK